MYEDLELRYMKWPQPLAPKPVSAPCTLAPVPQMLHTHTYLCELALHALNLKLWCPAVDGEHLDGLREQKKKCGRNAAKRDSRPD